MKVSYTSDLHLEFLDYPDFSKEKGGDVLLLCGDITTGNILRLIRTDAESRSQKKFFMNQMKTLCKKYTHIYYIMGNHEHYGSNFSETYTYLQEAFEEMQIPIVIFDNTYTDFDGWTFIGSTLWTSYGNADPIFMNCAHNGMNDYRLIGMSNGPFSSYVSHKATPDFFLAEHKASIDYIDKMTKDAEKVIVFTHMAPSHKHLNAIHCGNGLDHAYFTDLSEFIIDRPQIKYWISGHTHQHVDFNIGDCKMLSNPRGYYGEESYRNFKGLAHIEV